MDGGGFTKEPRGARVVSSKNSMPNINCLSLGNVEEHCRLIPTSVENDVTPTDLILDKVVVLSIDEVIVALNTNENKLSYEDEDGFGIEKNGNAMID